MGFFDGIGGALLSGGLGLLGGRQRNKEAQESAEAQMAFQERMRSTAHQTEVDDLRKAGLNPILSATGGMGAAVPAGAMYNPENTSASATEAFRVAKDAEKKDQEIENMKEEIKNLRTQQAKDISQATKTDLESANLPSIGKQIEQDTATAKALEHKHAVDAAVGNMYGHKLAQETNVAVQMEKNLKAQNVGENLRNQLLNLDLPVAKAVAQKAVLDGKLSEGAYADWFAAARRITESVGLSTSVRVK